MYHYIFNSKTTMYFLALMLIGGTGCSKTSDISSEDIIGLWIATEMEGQPLNDTSEYKFIMELRQDYSCDLSKIKNGKKRGGEGNWQIVKEDDAMKLYITLNGEKGFFYISELKGKFLTLVDPQKIDRPYKGKSLWKKMN